MKKIIDNLCQDKLTEKIIEIYGRKLTFGSCYKNVLVIKFKDLCGKALAGADYIEIFNNFNILFLLNIPQFSENNKDEAKRFMILIDNIYDKKVMLFCSAEVAIDELFKDLDINIYQRTFSRLKEIQSDWNVK
jgi:cell division protein ZapE